MGILFALLDAACWGVSNVMIRKAQLNTPDSIQAGTLLTLVVNNVINIFLFCIMLLIGNQIIQWNTTGLIFFAMGGLLNSCIGRHLQHMCFNKIGAARGGIIKGLSPLFVIAGGIIFLDETMSGAMWIGACIILVGVYTISFDTLNRNNDTETKNIKDSRELKLGIVLGLISCVFYASGNIFRKAGLLYINNAIISNTVGSFVALIVYIGFLITKVRSKSFNQMKKTFSLEYLKIFKPFNKEYVLGGIFASLALYFLNFSMQLIPVSLTNSIKATEPLFSILMSWLILKNTEKITGKTILGGCLAVVGVVILILA